MATKKLSPRQVEWLRILKPEEPYKKYLSLRENMARVATLPEPLDRGNFFSFVRGETFRDQRDADVIFSAYGTSREQIDLVEALGLQFGDSDKHSSEDTDSKLSCFLKDCGDILWGQGTECLSALQDVVSQRENTNQSLSRETGIGLIESSLLGLIDSIILNRSFRKDDDIENDSDSNGVANHQMVARPPFSIDQKRIIFGALLDYLVENRYYDRWSRWIVAISRESFRNAFSMIRVKGRSRDWFAKYAFDASDIKSLAGLSDEKLEELSFFVRQLNMRINEVRHRNYSDEQKRFDAVVKAKERSQGALSLIFRQIKDTALERKVVVRNSFKWALENVKPCWHALSKSKNPHRWYFLMCATRLMYDWARWNYYSVRDEDKRCSCDMYKEILNLANICAREKGVDVEISCRFKYMASTACRYMAEASSAGVWGEGLDDARRYVNKAVELAREALATWTTCAGINTGGKFAALRYRFSRHYARQATFAARWWLQHPQENGLRLLMPDISDTLVTNGVVHNRSMYGMDVIEEAYRYCKGSICGHVSSDDKLQDVICLKNKRCLEYEFHLRVWIEMLVFKFDIDYRDQENSFDVDYMAMVAFCQIVCIYCYLFKSTSAEKKFTNISLNVMRSARRWLWECGNKKVVKIGGKDVSVKKYVMDIPFNVSDLDKTTQAEPPSVEETRFEIVTSIKHSSATTAEVVDSSLWLALEKLAVRVLRVNKNCHETITEDMDRFVKEIWQPAKKGLDADLQQSIGKVAAKTTKFNVTHTTRDKVAEDWKIYPPFRFRNALVNAPGNNPRHVECLMRHYDLTLTKIQKEWEAAQ